MRDALGNIRTITDGSGNITESRLYSPYGEPYGGTGSAQTVYGFTGEPTDSTGFVHLRARYYNPSLGQFMNLDPKETANRFAYVMGNPVNATDPSGLMVDESWNGTSLWSVVRRSGTNRYRKMGSNAMIVTMSGGSSGGGGGGTSAWWAAQVQKQAADAQAAREEHRRLVERQRQKRINARTDSNSTEDTSNLSLASFPFALDIYEYKEVGIATQYYVALPYLHLTLGLVTFSITDPTVVMSGSSGIIRYGSMDTDRYQEREFIGRGTAPVSFTFQLYGSAQFWLDFNTQPGVRVGDFDGDLLDTTGGQREPFETLSMTTSGTAYIQPSNVASATTYVCNFFTANASAVVPPATFGASASPIGCETHKRIPLIPIPEISLEEVEEKLKKLKEKLLSQPAPQPAPGVAYAGAFGGHAPSEAEQAMWLVSQGHGAPMQDPNMVGGTSYTGWPSADEVWWMNPNGVLGGLGGLLGGLLNALVYG